MACKRKKLPKHLRSEMKRYKAVEKMGYKSAKRAKRKKNKFGL